MKTYFFIFFLFFSISILAQTPEADLLVRQNNRLRDNNIVLNDRVLTLMKENLSLKRDSALFQIRIKNLLDSIQVNNCKNVSKDINLLKTK